MLRPHPRNHSRECCVGSPCYTGRISEQAGCPARFSIFTNGPKSMCQRSCKLFLVLLLCGTELWAAPQVKQIGPGFYAYISDNDSSANSAFLVGSKGILVVDTGLNAIEGGKLPKAIRKVSDLPVRYIVNTHFHPDHQC